MQVRSHADLELTINGQELNGWSDSDPPIEIEPEGDLVDTVVGGDGMLYGKANAYFGGTMTIKFSPTSPGTQWAIQQLEEFKNNLRDKNAQRVYEGTLSDPTVGISISMEGGILVNAPPFPFAGQEVELMIRFELISSDMDGGTFHPSLTSDSSGGGGGAGTDFGI